jgi:hypothetical protein
LMKLKQILRNMNLSLRNKPNKDIARSRVTKQSTINQIKRLLHPDESVFAMKVVKSIGENK